MSFNKVIADDQRFFTAPFGGLMTVPTRAVALGRYGIGCELNSSYFADGAAYCEAEARKIGAPTLFDCLEESLAETA